LTSFEAVEAFQRHQMTDEVSLNHIASKSLFLFAVMMLDFLKTPLPMS